MRDVSTEFARLRAVIERVYQGNDLTHAGHLIVDDAIDVMERALDDVLERALSDGPAKAQPPAEKVLTTAEAIEIVQEQHLSFAASTNRAVAYPSGRIEELEKQTQQVRAAIQDRTPYGKRVDVDVKFEGGTLLDFGFPHMSAPIGGDAHYRRQAQEKALFDLSDMLPPGT